MVSKVIPYLKLKNSNLKKQMLANKGLLHSLKEMPLLLMHLKKEKHLLLIWLQFSNKKKVLMRWKNFKLELLYKQGKRKFLEEQKLKDPQATKHLDPLQKQVKLRKLQKRLPNSLQVVNLQQQKDQHRESWQERLPLSHHQELDLMQVLLITSQWKSSRRWSLTLIRNTKRNNKMFRTERAL